MINSNKIMEAVFSRYDQMHRDAQNRAYEINLFLDADPEWKELRYQIKSLSLQIAREKYEDRLQSAVDYERQRARLVKEQEELLARKGLKRADLSPKFSCPLCSDSGYTDDSKLCSCFYDVMATVASEILGIPAPSLPDFSQFLTHTQAQKSLKAKLEEYSEKFPPSAVKNLIFLGAPGTGKSFSAGCIAKSVMDKDHSVIYLSATKLGEVFLSYHVASVADKQAIFSLLCDCDLLVIDDLGTEPIMKNVTVEYLTAVISERLNYKKPFIITTNLSVQEIKDRYTERFSSRISGAESARIAFNGSDMRMKK